MKDDYNTNSRYLTYAFCLWKVGRMYFLSSGVKGLTVQTLLLDQHEFLMNAWLGNRPTIAKHSTPPPLHPQHSNVICNYGIAGFQSPPAGSMYISEVDVAFVVSNRAITHMKFSLFFPIIPWLLQLILFGWFAGVLVYPYKLLVEKSITR